jgi:error-prone DNA polymerase
VKYLAAFTCALLNNQPMGFYSPAVLVDDAKRHGLRVKAIDVQVSRWSCTIETEADGSLSMRMGLGYAKGLRKESAEAIVAARERDGRFRSTEDLALRVPYLNRKELKECLHREFNTSLRQKRHFPSSQKVAASPLL